MKPSKARNTVIKTSHKKLQRELPTQGYTILQRKDDSNVLWEEKLRPLEEHLDAFQRSWENLALDNFLHDGGHYRYRRYAVFTWQRDQALRLLPHEPHYQSTYRNAMNGGIYRDFEPFETSTLDNPVLNTIIDWCAHQFSFEQTQDWRVQAHQFRIKTNNDEAGKPTPEGIHRDGADFILIMLLKRHNIIGGVSHVYDSDKKLVFGAVLDEFSDTILIDDRKVWHGVSEIYSQDDSKEGYRDVLVLTFHKQVLQ